MHASGSLTAQSLVLRDYIIVHIHVKGAERFKKNFYICAIENEEEKNVDVI